MEKKKFLSFLFAVILCVGLFPTTVLAVDDPWAEGKIELSFGWVSPDEYRNSWQSPAAGDTSWLRLPYFSNGAAALIDSSGEEVASYTGEARHTFSGLKAGTYTIRLTVLDSGIYKIVHGVVNGGPIPHLITEYESTVEVTEGNTSTILRWVALEYKAYGFKTVTDMGSFKDGSKEKTYYTGWNGYSENTDPSTASGHPYLNTHNGIYWGDHAGQYSNMTSIEEPVLDAAEQANGWRFIGWKCEGDPSGKIYTTDEALLITVKGDIVLRAVFERFGYTVTWKYHNTTLETDEYVPENTAPSYDGDIPTMGAEWEFVGWSKNPNAAVGLAVEDLAKVSENVTYYAIFQKSAADGKTIIKVEKTGTSGNVDTYTIFYSDGTTYDFTITNGENGKDGAAGKDGKDGVDGKDGCCAPVPEDLNCKDHFAYIIGYPDGNVHPEGTITRAEVATIFFRMLDDTVRSAFFTRDNSFSDVEEGQWYNNAISTMARMGVVKGYEDGTFRPNQNITRAEFAAIAARFDKTASSNLPVFTDTYGHWATYEIGKAARNGWINGYPDGGFKPNRAITRAEAMALVNRVLRRDPQNPADLLNNMIKWPDNMDTSIWYYLDVQEATNSHEYERTTKGTERWTALGKLRDWSAFER